jgi:hypothetical protein
MARSQKIHGWVKEARYFPAENSIVLVLQEVETKRYLKPMQFTGSALSALLGDIRLTESRQAAMEQFVAALKQRKTPLMVEFEGEEA